MIGIFFSTAHEGVTHQIGGKRTVAEYEHLTPTMRVIISAITKSTLFIYALIAILLIIIALLTSLDAVYLILTIFSGGDLITGILEVLHILLLTIIVVEVLETVTEYFRTKKILVRPILIAGLTAMVRKVLILNVEQIQLVDSVSIIGMIAVLTFAIYVVGKTEYENPSG